ncbi:MAG: hypothetical protein HPY84_01840 [Syntrophobacteraceae bacterium]|nr:hypothetical protein [Syntrophobacteraceae bacterium]
MKIIHVSRNFKTQDVDVNTFDQDEPVLMVDLDRCICCGSCQYACRIEHAGGDVQAGRPRSIPVAVKHGESAKRTMHLPLSCRYCNSPCPYYSLYNFWTTCPAGFESPDQADACDSCVERLGKGFMPACATRCTMKCIYFGYPRDIAFVLNEKRLREMGDLVIRALDGVR